MASLLDSGEVQDAERNPAQWVPGFSDHVAVSLQVKPSQTCRMTRGGWRRNGGKIQRHEAGRPEGARTAFHAECMKSRPSGVRAFVGAKKWGNAHGAKGRRKVEADEKERQQLVSAIKAKH